MRKILFIAIMLSLPFAATRLTQGFRISKLRLDWPADPKWETSVPASLNEILSEPFTFLGKGVQSFVFESPDKRYVVKLLRFDRKRDKTKYIPLFNACKTAYDRLKEETGLIYVHLNPTAIDLPIFHCKDAIGRSFEINLNSVRFIVQKKVEELEEVLLRERNDPIGMQKRLDQFFHLIRSRASIGVWNKDPSLSRNFGFLGGQAIEFDFGNYRIDPNLDPNREMERYHKKMRRWLSKNAPEYYNSTQ
ncbi:MAG: hypothetical protein K1X28_07500 [Parachlamydiales bacterium]|nr:hypothetical protein [Parachlamydiales bacterium]